MARMIILWETESVVAEVLCIRFTVAEICRHIINGLLGVSRPRGVC